MADTIKLPEIPRTVQPELYNYFIQLHLNITLLQKEIDELKRAK